MLQDEYFVIERENNDNYPLFSWDESRGKYGLGKPVEFEEPIKLRLGEPISPNFEWVDYHSNPTGPIVSKRIADVLASLDPFGIQLVPANVRNPKDPLSELKEYIFIHVWNRISCLDTENSEIEYSRSGNTIFGIDKLVIKEDVLGQFELRERQIFELSENTAVLLVHQTVKDAILSVNPNGVRFFKATEWNSDSSFE
jgi:hypothetical protein